MTRSDVINILALAGIAVGIHLIYNLYRERSESKAKGKGARGAAASQAEAEKPKELKLTKRELINFTGKTRDEPVYIAVKGIIYDVSVNDGRGFYGPGGPYSVFAGRDASRLFSLFDFDGGVTEEELDAPIDPLDNLTADQEDSLDAYTQLFESKYKAVGVLVEPEVKKLDSQA